MKYNSTPINSLDDYLKLFEKVSTVDLKLALQHALDTRKLEIELYWKRATYFWTFIAFTFGGFFALSTIENSKVPEKPELLFVISCVGFTFSLGWYLANRGSKFWQENWEKHVDLLENKIFGPLQKTVIDTKSFSIFNPIGPYKFSVTKINQILSFYITLIWLFLGLRSFNTIAGNQEPISHFNLYVVAALTIIAVIGIVITNLSSRTSFNMKTHKIIEDDAIPSNNK